MGNMVAAAIIATSLALLSGCTDRDRRSPPAKTAPAPQQQPAEQRQNQQEPQSSDDATQSQSPDQSEQQGQPEETEIAKPAPSQSTPATPAAPRQAEQPIEQPTPAPAPQERAEQIPPPQTTSPVASAPQERAEATPAVPAPIAAPTIAQGDIESPQPFIVLMSGRVRSQDLRVLTEAMKKSNRNPSYGASMWMNETPVSYSANAMDIQDILITQVSGREMAEFKEQAETIPGMRFIYRPIQTVQATVTMNVRNLDDKVIASFKLGEARNTKDLATANLNAPISYLLSENGRDVCHRVDAGCLQSLKERGFLEGIQPAKLSNDQSDTNKERRRGLTTREVLASMISQAADKLQDKNAKVGDKAQQASGLESLRRFFGSKLSSIDREAIIRSIDLQVSNIKVVSPKDPQGELPINPAFLNNSVANRSAGPNGPFVYDVGNRYLFALPIANPPAVTSGLTDEHLTPVILNDFYNSVLGVLK